MPDTQKEDAARKSEKLTKTEAKSNEKDQKKSDKKVKDEAKSEKQQEKDYSLPPPLQIKERLQGQSTPKKPVLEEESVIDKDISEMEKSIQEEDTQIEDITKNKEKLDQLKRKLQKSQKKLKATEEEGEGQVKNVTINDLRKNEKICKKAHKTLSSLGLVSES